MKPLTQITLTFHPASTKPKYGCLVIIHTTGDYYMTGWYDRGEWFALEGEVLDDDVVKEWAYQPYYPEEK